MLKKVSALLWTDRWALPQPTPGTSDEAVRKLNDGQSVLLKEQHKIKYKLASIDRTLADLSGQMASLEKINLRYRSLF